MIVLDTHVLLWWATGEHAKLSKPALRAIKREHSEGELLVSSISAWEIAMLVARNRIALTMDVGAWLDTTQQIENLRYVAVNNAIAVDSVNLPPPFHADPADRLIVATARAFNSPLVTADKKILAYAGVKAVW